MPQDPVSGGHAAAAGPAPGRLELVRAFVNTRDVEAGTDELDTGAGLDHWLAAYALAGLDRPDQATTLSRPAATEADLARARSLREGLRAVLRGHARRG